MEGSKLLEAPDRSDRATGSGVGDGASRTCCLRGLKTPVFRKNHQLEVDLGGVPAQHARGIPLGCMVDRPSARSGRFFLRFSGRGFGPIGWDRPFLTGNRLRFSFSSWTPRSAAILADISRGIEPLNRSWGRQSPFGIAVVALIGARWRFAVLCPGGALGSG